jgi:hypothetical protein
LQGQEKWASNEGSEPIEAFCLLTSQNLKYKLLKLQTQEKILQKYLWNVSSKSFFIYKTYSKHKTIVLHQDM